MSTAEKTPAKIPSNYAAAREQGRGSAELLILPDGRILAHNITPAMAALLAELAPDDADMRGRAAALGRGSGFPPRPAPDSSSLHQP